MRTISEIAKEIRQDWGGKISPHAEPYIEAMEYLTSIEDDYMFDTADYVVRRFLGNAQGWRGETARRVKKELNNLIK